MTIIEKINADYITAFKEKNTIKKNILGVVKGEVQTAEKKGSAPTDENVVSVLKKIEKGLKESIEKGDETAKEELKSILPYLPTQLEETQIRTILTGFKQNGIDSVPGMMKEFNTKFKGQADNRLVSTVATSILNPTE